MPRLHAIQPAAVGDWDAHFIAYATALDDTGFPLRGSFGIGYGCFTDLSTASPADICRAIARPPTSARFRLITQAYAALTPGAVLALKRGAPVVAFIRIVGPYMYDATHAHHQRTTHPHRWNYEVIRKARPSEVDNHSGNHYPTFVRDYAPCPADLDTAPPSPVLAVTEVPAAPPSPVLTVPEVPEAPPSPVLTDAEAVAMYSEIMRWMAARRATKAAVSAAEKAQEVERMAGAAVRAAEEAVRAATRAEKACAAALKL